MEWAVVGVVVVIGLAIFVITRRRALEADAHARRSASDGDDGPAEGRD
jgi:hypothetical protein